jgi:feruloyl-CoA synthase
MNPPTQGTARRAEDEPPLRAIRYAPVSVARETRPDGGCVLRSREPLAPYDTSVARLFRAAVERRPDHPFLAERDGSGAWRTLTYGEARPRVDNVAQALLARGLSAERPVMVLSGNAIEHGIVKLACFTAGIPVAPLSVAYSLQSQDHAKLKHIVALLTPGLIYVADTGPFARSLAALDLAEIELVAGRNGANLDNVTGFDALEHTTAAPAVDKAVAATDADTIAKFLFTSGSTGFPKAVVNTHGMMTANQQQIVQTWPFLHDDDLVLVDWLPWNHTFAGNHNFNLILRLAGTLYLDAGKPVPELVKETVRTLSEVSPTIYLSVPAGYAALLPHLEQNAALAQNFFKRLRLIFYAAAALPQDLWQRLDAIALRTTGERIPMTSSWGATETAPMAAAAHYLLDRAGNIGVPAPGVALKLVPTGEKLEVRVRGPNVTPGYWRQPELTAAAFDEEGFYKVGDAFRFEDPNDPNKGLVFDGRLAEDFKLTTGTFVHPGPLRVGVLAAASPVLQDAAVAGENRDRVGLLAWLNPGGCQKLLGGDAPLPPADLAANQRVRERVRGAIARWNAENGGSSTRVARLLLLKDAPSIDANEITDKGYVNQRVALERRRTDVERLFAASPDSDVMVFDPPMS